MWYKKAQGLNDMQQQIEIKPTKTNVGQDFTLFTIQRYLDAGKTASWIAQTTGEPMDKVLQIEKTHKRNPNGNPMNVQFPRPL